MTTSDRSTVVGVFEDRAFAERAINELRQAGFSEEQIGFASFPPEQYLAGFERTLLQKHLPCT